jgi:GT2 family glycosyltransferase
MNAVLMVARNNLSLTKLAVRSVLAQDITATLIVVDNASTDGTTRWLSTKRIATIYYTRQKSLAACWNDGLTRFWRAGADRVLVVNNDVELLPCTLRVLIEVGRPFVTAVSVNSKDQLKTPEITPEWIKSARPHPDFSAFMIRRDVHYRVGLFNEDYYPAYAEDSEYHIRMHKAGIEAVCVDLPFYHAGAQTLKNASPQEQAIIKRGADRNRERFKAVYGCYPGSDEYYQLFAQLPLER